MRQHTGLIVVDHHWINGSVRTPAGEVPRVTPQLRLKDRMGAWRVRVGIGRMKFRVDPGLYAVGAPDAESAVFVSANYRMSFDRRCSQLGGRDGWILVLDTKGINVWCAAGKGTFGTDEIVLRVQAARLDQVVSHRRLVLPQLGAPGVSAHDVKKQCGFRVIYGPVRAQDLPEFLDAGMKATPEMRRVRFRSRWLPRGWASGSRRALCRGGFPDGRVTVPGECSHTGTGY